MTYSNFTVGNICTYYIEIFCQTQQLRTNKTINQQQTVARWRQRAITDVGEVLLQIKKQ